MFRARRTWVVALSVLFAYGMQLSAAVAAPSQGLPSCRDDHPAHVDLSHIPPCQQDEPPAEVPPVEQPPAVEPDPPASNDPPPCTEDHPAVPDLSHLPPCQDETPEAEDPPAEEPPAEVPPAEQPLADEPDPPASNDPPLCTEDHPAVPDLSGLPPCQDETPEAEDPPVDEPSAEQAGTDTSETTASDDPPEPPPHEEPPAPPEEPLSEEPRQPSLDDGSGDLSTEEPPSDELVAEDPPAKQEPAEQLGTSRPADQRLTASDSGDDLPPPALPSEPTEQDPREVPIELTTRAGGGLTIDISNFVHEAGAFTALAHVSPTNGTLSVAGLVATYTPNPGFYGVDAFTLRVCDFSTVCLDITASVIVPPINDFLLTTGAALAEFFSGGRSTQGTNNDVNLLPGTHRVVVPLAGLTAMVGASLWFGLDSVGSVLRRWLTMVAAKS